MHSFHSKRHLPRPRRGVNALVDREPALINLPVTLPSVPLLSPLLDPILTPLIDGQHPTSTTTAVASPTPTPSQTSPSDGSSDPGSSSGGNGGNSGSGNGDGNSDGTSDGGNGNTAGGSTSTSDGNPASGSTSTQSPGSSPSGTSPTIVGTVTSTDSSSSSSSLPSSSAAEPASDNAAAEPVFNAATNVDTDNSIGNDNSVDNDDSSSTSGSLSSVIGGQSSSRTSTGTISAPTSVGSNTPGSGSGGGKSGVDPASISGATSSHSLSGGAIGGIVVGVLFLLALIFFILRRRALIRRNERHTRWLFFAGEAEPKYGSASDMARQRQSQRSSFGTPFNGSLFSEHTVHASPTFGNVPPFPPTAQGHTPHSAPLIVTVTTDEFVSGQRTSTFSIGSGHSSSSYSDSSDGQVLTIPSPVHDGRGSAADTPTTPMSVRPFSPSERFSFPKPPECQSVTFSANNIPATAKADTNPFVDPERTTPTSGSPVSLGLVTEKQTLDPFSDPSDRPATASSIGSVGAIAGTRETVSRPFAPTMHDELMVIPGEEVTVIQAFDDGWAQVQNERKEIGLIPLDCFRPLGKEVPSFLASKRVSSYLGGNTSA